MLRSAPPPGPPGMTARAAASLEEFAEGCGVQHLAFGMTPEQAADDAQHFARRWRDQTRVMHVVSLDGKIVAAGTCVITDHGLHLHGGATHPDFRGRGAYRALLAARWAEAVGRGTPVLLTQGGSRSLSILERAGFERVGHVHMLVDHFGTESGAPDS